jgi:hypothetical protein
MQNRTSILSFFVVAAGTAALLATTANSQLGVPKNYVSLQPTTPGTSQSGNSNVSGTSRAGQFVGGGAGVTGVNAAQLGGLAPNQYGLVNNNNSWIGLNTFSSAGNSFTGNGAGLTNLNAANIASGILDAARLPNPLVLSGTSTPGIIQVTNSSTAAFSSGIIATMSNTTQGPGSAAIRGANSGTGIDGSGVYGSHGGSGFGVYGESQSGRGVNGLSTNGTAVFGQSTNNYAGSFLSLFSHGLKGQTVSSAAGMFGVEGESNSPSGAGVRGTSNASTGSGVWGRNAQQNGIGVLGESTDTINNGVGVFGSAASPTGTGVFGTSNGVSGTGVVAQNSAGGRAFLAQAKAEFQANVSIGAGSNPLFPLDFAETLGNKISLWGTSPTSNYGFGIQNNQFQMFSATPNDNLSFGSGGSTAFSEIFRLAPALARFTFLPAGTDIASSIYSPYDMVLDHDFDNDSPDSWLRIYTNNFTIEQVRIVDGDEAGTSFDGAVNANGIDFAEGFRVYDSTLEPGDLVVNSGTNWEYITRSSAQYQSGVIGVISTKPAFVAGMSFDAEDRMDAQLTQQRDEARRNGNTQLEKQLTKQMNEMMNEAYRPVAFMGRVPVKVTGTVKVGDHLTASQIPGTAMAMTRPGHSIGVALEASSGSGDKIMVMIQPGFFAGTVPFPTGNGIGELNSIRTEVERLRAENQDLRERLERLEKLVLSNKH